MQYKRQFVSVFNRDIIVTVNDRDKIVKVNDRDKKTFHSWYCFLSQSMTVGKIFTVIDHIKSSRK